MNERERFLSILVMAFWLPLGCGGVSVSTTKPLGHGRIKLISW